MKKNFFFYSMLICLAAFAISCSDDDDPKAPAAAGTISGASENVCPDVTVSLSIGAIEGATSFQWYKDGVSISGATSDSYTVTASGSYTVAGVNTVGEGAKSAAKQVTIKTCIEKPAAAGAISGASANACPEKTVTLTIAAIERATSYQWYKDGSSISGATSTTYTVTASGSYTVEGVNASGKGTMSAAKQVTITTCSEGDDQISGTWNATGFDVFARIDGKADALSWTENITKAGQYWTVNNFNNGGSTQPALRIFYDATDDVYFIQSIEEQLGTISIEGQDYPFFQTVGGYDAATKKAYTLTGGGIPFTISGNSLALPATIPVNIGGVQTPLIPIFGSMVTISGKNYFYDAVGSLVYTKSGQGSPMNIVIEKAERGSLPLQVIEENLQIKK